MANAIASGQPWEASSFPQPLSLEDFDIAVVCALTLEADPVVALLDSQYDNRRLSIPSSDNIAYVTGALSNHNVVIAFLPEPGRSGSAAVAQTLRRTFPNISLALVVGVCGSVPFFAQEGRQVEVLLGDVVISQGIVRYDYGRQTPQGFEVKTLSRDLLARPSEKLRSRMALVQSINSRERLASKMAEYMAVLRQGSPRLRASYPTACTDSLYLPSYRHQERGKSCSEAGCGRNARLVPRGRLAAFSVSRLAGISCAVPGSLPLEPEVHFGWTASADRVMRDGNERDLVARSLEVVNFEMEGAGVAEKFDCVVIKGVADYADSHKNDGWQRYAAATAAACAKAFISEFWDAPVKPCPKPERPYSLPFDFSNMPYTKNFVPRPDAMAMIRSQLLPDPPVWDQRKVCLLSGLGGIGKTQLALNFALNHQGEFDSVFWVDGRNEASLKAGLAKCFGRIPQGQFPEAIRGHQQDQDAAAQCFLSWLKLPANSRWLLVLDNVDKRWQRSDDEGEDEEEVGVAPASKTCSYGSDKGAYDLARYISMGHGSILITSRLDSIVGMGTGLLLPKANATLAGDIFNRWRFSGLSKQASSLAAEDHKAISKILKRLDGLPLALASAGSYIGQGSTPAGYLRLYEKEWHRLAAENLGLDSYNRTMWTTWILSFRAIGNRNPDAARLLQLWGFLDNKDLWMGLLNAARIGEGPPGWWPAWLRGLATDQLRFDRSIRDLRSYSMLEPGTLEPQSDQPGFSIHPVLHEWAANSVEHMHLQVRDEDGVLDRGDCARLALSLTDPLSVDLAARTQKMEKCHFTDMMPLSERVVPHAVRVVNQLHHIPSHAWKRSLEDKTFAALLCLRIADLLRVFGHFELAEAILQRCIDSTNDFEVSIDQLGPGHVWLFGVFTCLAVVYISEGRHLPKAEKILRRVLRCYVAMPSSSWDYQAIEHTMGGLGYLYGIQKRWKAAKTWKLRALRNMTSGPQSGNESLSVKLRDLGNIAMAEGSQQQATELYWISLKFSLARYGQDHRETLETIGLLAMANKRMGNLQGAVALAKQSHEGLVKIFGISQQPTLGSAAALGSLYIDLGRAEDAVRLLVPALEGARARFGENGPGSSLVMYELARAHATRGDFPAARRLIRTALAGSGRSPQNPAFERAFLVLQENLEAVRVGNLLRCCQVPTPNSG
ncbi:hypothetical protein RB595_001409 [Gaeumannomyces hyphopodioides]